MSEPAYATRVSAEGGGLWGNSSPSPFGGREACGSLGPLFEVDLALTPHLKKTSNTESWKLSSCQGSVRANSPGMGISN